MDLRPLGILNPAVLPPLGHLEPLPKLTSIPSRLTTPPLYLLEDYITPQRKLVAQLIQKIQAEDQRMRRLLPEPPPGLHWEVELQSREPEYNFTMDKADVEVRLVYRLKDN